MHLPGAAERRAATNVRAGRGGVLRERAEQVASLSLSAIAEATRGASVVYRDPLSPLLARRRRPAPARVRRRLGAAQTASAARSPTSSRSRPTSRPRRRAAAGAPEEGRVCLEWTAPETDVLGQPVEIGGYRVYRRTLAEEEYDRPLNATADRPDVLRGRDGALRRRRFVYTVRAVLAKNPKVEGLPADELPVVLRATSTRRRARRAWTRSRRATSCAWSGTRWTRPISRVSRLPRGGRRPAASLTPQPLTDPFYTDEDRDARAALPLHRARRSTGRATAARRRRRRRRAVLGSDSSAIGATDPTRRISAIDPGPSLLGMTHGCRARLHSASHVPPSRFVKMAGGGNDFLVFEADGRAPDRRGSRARLALVCRRGLSVGADGALFLSPGEDGPRPRRLLQRRRRPRDLLRQRDALRRALRGPPRPGRRRRAPLLETGWGPIEARVDGESVTLALPAVPRAAGSGPDLGPRAPADGDSDEGRRAAPRGLRARRPRQVRDRPPRAAAAPPSRHARGRQRQLRAGRRRQPHRRCAPGNGASRARRSPAARASSPSAIAAGRQGLAASPVTCATKSGVDLVVEFRDEGEVDRGRAA